MSKIRKIIYCITRRKEGAKGSEGERRGGEGKERREVYTWFGFVVCGFFVGGFLISWFFVGWFFVSWFWFVDWCFLGIKEGCKGDGRKL